MPYWLPVSVQQPPVEGERAAASPLRRLRWLFWGVALVGGVGIGMLVAMRSSSPQPAAIPTAIPPARPQLTWAAGEKVAPAFSLHDENGKPVSLAAFRGHPVLLAFMDPLCQDFCPREAKTINQAEALLPKASRPAVIAVSVNIWGNTPATLRHDEQKWKLTSLWHWGVADKARLSKVWNAYEIAVVPAQGHDVQHTAATFLIDAKGDQRAIWLWPFRAADVARTVRQLG